MLPFVAVVVVAVCLPSAQVKQIKKTTKEGQKTKLLFHFLGWGPSFNEWIEVGRWAPSRTHFLPPFCPFSDPFRPLF